MLRHPGRVLVALMLLLFVSTGAAAQPAASGPSAVIQRLDDTLLDVMRNAQRLGYQGRYQRLAPVLTEVYNFPAMAQLAVGPENWNNFTPEQRQRFIDAFTRMSISTYAARFDGYSGESFRIISEEPQRGGVLVKTQLVRPADEPVALNYVMRQFDGRSRIIDVFLEGTFSELSRYRAEYTSVLRRQGYDALINQLETVIRNHERQS